MTHTNSFIHGTFTDISNIKSGFDNNYIGCCREGEANGVGSSHLRCYWKFNVRRLYHPVSTVFMTFEP